MGGSEEKQESPQDDVPRISSGTPYLDQVLAGSVAERGDCALYVTLLAETHSRMMLHLRSHITTLVTEQTNTLFGPDLHSPIKGVEAVVDYRSHSTRETAGPPEPPGPSRAPPSGVSKPSRSKSSRPVTKTSRRRPRRPGERK